MRFLTDRQASQIDELKGKNRAAREVLLADATFVYEWIGDNRLKEEDELRQAAEARGIGPDRLNDAIGVMRATGKIIGIGATLRSSPWPPTTSKARPSNSFSPSQPISTSPSTMTKAELIAAIREARANPPAPAPPPVPAEPTPVPPGEPVP